MSPSVCNSSILVASESKSPQESICPHASEMGAGACQRRRLPRHHRSQWQIGSCPTLAPRPPGLELPRAPRPRGHLRGSHRPNGRHPVPFMKASTGDREGFPQGYRVINSRRSMGGIYSSTRPNHSVSVVDTTTSSLWSSSKWSGTGRQLVSIPSGRT